MRKLIAILWFVFVIEACYGQTLSQKVQAIKTKVAKIDQAGGYRMKVLNNEDFLTELPDGGGKLTAYYKKNVLVKIVEDVYLSSCILSTAYYLDNHQLIFAYTQGKETFYDEKLSTFDAKKIMLKMENRFYFENAKLIKSLLKGSTRCSGAPGKDVASQYLENSTNYQQKLKQE